MRWGLQASGCVDPIGAKDGLQDSPHALGVARAGQSAALRARGVLRDVPHSSGVVTPSSRVMRTPIRSPMATTFPSATATPLARSVIGVLIS